MIRFAKPARPHEDHLPFRVDRAALAASSFGTAPIGVIGGDEQEGREGGDTPNGQAEHCEDNLEIDQPGDANCQSDQQRFANAGADIISVHVEASPHLQRTLHAIRALGKRAGVVLNPHTPEDTIRYVLEDVDLVLVMSVNPGFGGQSFLPLVLPKVRALRQMIDASGRSIELEIDGGIGPENARLVTEAGATVLVAGSAIFGQKDRGAAMRQMRSAAAG